MISLIAQIIDKVISILILAIIIRAILSFVPQLRPNQLLTLLYDVTDPLLKPFQRFRIGAAMGLDFSPLIAIVVLSLIQSLIMRLFYYARLF
ncbi:YggT family protein [Desulfosporosinus sp. PR]|uniref:YggT family protein n=1 Tax=Candidatus Desulfosporosinus nitrosoreducens TaxID=3401928 RepID=UPI0027FC0678|nr:YggT family protein [Desulfosporosinus sp. PR]MDQ7096144.1 YggT family protein [Desulfosporosinus sp. PR]